MLTTALPDKLNTVRIARFAGLTREMVSIQIDQGNFDTLARVTRMRVRQLDADEALDFVNWLRSRRRHHDRYPGLSKRPAGRRAVLKNLENVEK